MDRRLIVLIFMYDVHSMPTTYFVGRDGRIVYKHRGLLTQELLSRFVSLVR